MTALQYVENIIRQNWQPSITGRPHDVGQLVENGGQVKIVYESDADWRQMDLANYDYLTLRDGGLADISAQSFGWTQEDVISRVDVDVRTTGHPNENRPGRIALYGERGAGDLGQNESPRWGGLAGEVHRALKMPRKGDQEFSLIDTNTIDDMSAQMGGQIWRSLVQVRLETRSRTINTKKSGGYGLNYGDDYGE